MMKIYFIFNDVKYSVGAAVCVSVLSPFQKMSPDRQNICCQIDNSNVLFKKKYERDS